MNKPLTNKELLALQPGTTIWIVTKPGSFNPPEPELIKETLSSAEKFNRYGIKVTVQWHAYVYITQYRWFFTNYWTARRWARKHPQ